MHFHKLSNIQLYRLSRNKAHLKIIRKGAQAELDNRALTIEEMNELVMPDAAALENAKKPLHPGLKVLAVVLPQPVVIHAAVAAWYLGKGQVLRWKQYWWFLLIGFTLWTMIAILLFTF